MKKIILASIALTALIFSGCEDRLDIPQKGVILPEDYYKTDADADAESALASAYYTAGRFYSNTMRTTAGWNECPFLSMWEYASDNIYAAGNNKADTDTKKRCVAEARVLRDQAQLLLTLGWGTAPIADHVYNSTDDKPGNATFEMWLDGTRFQDLVRWGDAEAELGHNGEDYPSFCDAMFTKNEPVHRGYIERADADWCKKLYNV